MEFMVGIAFLLCVATALILLVGVYNALISNRENIEKAWFNIDVILKQRYDEIPQLIRICEQ
jgi:LemA protein